MLRSLLLKRLGLAGDDEVIKESLKKFSAHVDGVQSIPADLRSAVYRYPTNMFYLFELMFIFYLLTII